MAWAVLSPSPAEVPPAAIWERLPLSPPSWAVWRLGSASVLRPCREVDSANWSAPPSRVIVWKSPEKPPAVYQALVDNSNKRFAAQAVDRRAEAQLRKHLADPAPALAFFQSPLGRKIVAAELLATRRDQLAKNAQGLPHIEADATRSLIIGHLAQALPAREAGAEVSLAIAGVAADSLSQMIPRACWAAARPRACWMDNANG